ncbi:hypothetical protein EDD36DRAFT_454205 [Exophiala viscosa]|uniref:Fe2OG dioxygenase domain-containing protein n=1 Tax=Exophiala viscosa TaxID=2486360 RepID=A0AAN6DM77_9EURO|nr:hypothetical protein EDD36DRAFT_454205 [Exophiala viscosa]
MPSATTPDANLPIFDFSRFQNSDQQERKEASKEIVQAFKTFGFIYIINYGISQEKIKDLFYWSAKFHELPDEVRNSPELLRPEPVPGATGYIARGFSPLGREKISQDTFDDQSLKALRQVQDAKEFFDMGPEAGVPAVREPNRWPSEDVLPGFKEYFQTFYTEGNELSLEIQRCLALGLDLDEEFFTNFHQDADNLLRLIHYPAVERKAIRMGEKARIPAHTDFGTLTMLFQDSVGGLEVADPKNPQEYISATPIEGAAIVNIGDFLKRWTNDILKSNFHRVVEPPAELELADGNELAKERYSIPYFVQADRNKTIGCITSLEKNAEPKYPPISAQEYLNMRTFATYKL